MLKKSSLASLRRQRTTCPCNWCARNLGFLGKSGKHDPGTAAKAKNDSKSIRENILRGRRLHTEIVNSSEPESISKRSGSPDSDSSDGWFESNNSRLLEELKKTAESRPQAEQEDSTGWRHVELFKAKRIEDISSTSSIASSSCKESEGSEEVDFIEYLEKLRRRKYREECEPLEEIENCDINENVSKLEDDSESEVSDDGGWSKRRSTASDSEYTADLEQLVTMDDSCDQEDEELRDIFLGEHRVRSPEACDARTVSQKRAILCKEMNCVFCADSNERAPEEELPDNPSDFLCRERVARLQEEFWPYGSRMGEFSPETTDLDDSSDTEMPSEKESKMNLSALKQVDPEINEIVDSAAQVALYQYSTQTGQWAKTEVEGALYVYAHRNAHQRGLIILNRNSPKNYKEPIRADIEFKIKTPFLIYKTTAGHIFGAWFYVEEECTRVGNLCCRLVSYLKKRGKNETGSQPDNNNQQQGISVLQNLLPPSALPKVDAQSGANIMSLLKKAEGGSAQVTNGSSNGGNHHHNGNNGQHHQNGKSKKQPLTPNNSNHNESGGRQQENGRHRKATGDSTPGVPVVHKPVPTKSLPSSVEQLFKSAANSQHQHKKQQQQPQQGSSSSSSSTTAKQLYKPMPESTTSKTPRGAVNGGGGVGGGGGGDLERLLGDLTRSSLESPPPSVALVETKVEALTPLNPCMASILSKLNESAQKVQREAEMARNSPTTEEALLRAFKGPLHNNGIEKKLTLITPEMLEESLSQGPSTPPQTLSRYELKSALLHLLDTDDEFLTKIHNAYVQGVSRRKL